MPNFTERQVSAIANLLHMMERFPKADTFCIPIALGEGVSIPETLFQSPGPYVASQMLAALQEAKAHILIWYGARNDAAVKHRNLVIAHIDAAIQAARAKGITTENENGEA